MTNELDALKAQVAMLREALVEIERDARHLAKEHNKGFEDRPRMSSDARDWMDAAETASTALAATPVDAMAWLAKREKLAAAEALEKWANFFEPVSSDDKAWRAHLLAAAAQLRQEAK